MTFVEEDALTRLGADNARLAARVEELEAERDKQEYLKKRLSEARAKQPDWEQLWGETTEKLEAAEAALECLREEAAKRREFMDWRGYRRCDVAACNCNSWHGGHAEQRLHEAHEAVAEAGGSTNGVILTDAIINLGTRALAAEARVASLEKALEEIANMETSPPHDPGDYMPPRSYIKNGMEQEIARAVLAEDTNG